MRAPSENTPVITGSGLVTALGFGVEAAFEALCAGDSGIRPTGDVAADSGCALAAFVPPPWLRAEVPDDLRTQAKFLNGAGEMAAQAAHEAQAGAGWEVWDVAPGDGGLWLAQLDSWDWPCIYFRSAVLDATENLQRPLEAEALNRSSVRHTKPFFILDSLKNNAFSFISRWWELRGANTSACGFAGIGLGLVDMAARTLARGDQTRALVVGAARPANGVARRDLLDRGLARPRADPVFRPLDRSGTGGAPGEAAAALALERMETAKARGAEPRAAILGFGATSGEPLGSDLPAPTTETVRLAVARALERAEIEAGDLLGVVLPALGRPEIDGAMLSAIAALPTTEGAPIVAWRGATGHCALASEVAEAVLAVEALEAGRLPGTTGLTDALDSPGRPLPDAAVEGSGCAVLVVSAGLQGEAQAMVLGAVRPR